MFLRLLIHSIFILGPILGALFSNTASALPEQRRPYYESPPTNDEIERAFTGVGRDQTIVSALLDEEYTLMRRFIRYLGGKSIVQAFPNEMTMFLRVLQIHDPDAYDTLIQKLRLKFYRESAGTVWLLALEDILYKKSCGTWASYEFKALKQNPNVDKIMWVDSRDFGHRVVYWERGGPESDNSDSEKPPIQPRPGGNSLLGNLFRIGVSAAGPIGGTGAIFGGTQGGRPASIPGSTTPTFERPEEVNQPDPGMKTDVLPDIVGALPVEVSPAFDEKWDF